MELKVLGQARRQKMVRRKSYLGQQRGLEAAKLKKYIRLGDKKYIGLDDEKCL